MRNVIGIDPGAKGGIAVIDDRGSFVACHRPEWIDQQLDPNTVDWLRAFAEGGDVCVGVEEPVMFGGPGMALTMVKVAISSGNYLGALSALGIWKNVMLVRPQTWQAAVVGTLARGTPQKDRKAHSKALALRMHPAAEEALRVRGGGIHEGLAEALLIAEWRRQVLQAHTLAGVAT